MIVVLALTAGVGIAESNDSQTFTGSYDWSDGRVDDLTAEFKPDGADTWKVKFDFRWNGQSHNWTGTAKGSLAEGSQLTGTATDGYRKWVFEASIEDGVMSGSHREIREGRKPYESGTFAIKRDEAGKTS